MRKRKIRDLLDQHAKVLILGVNEDESLLAQYPDDSEELKSFFQLARAIRAALVPLKTPESFRLELQRKLRSLAPTEIIINDSTIKQRRWLVVAAAGSTLSVLGIMLYILRRIRTASRASQPVTTAA
jgi:hypothetical protein